MQDRIVAWTWWIVLSILLSVFFLDAMNAPPYGGL